MKKCANLAIATETALVSWESFAFFSTDNRFKISVPIWILLQNLPLLVERVSLCSLHKIALKLVYRFCCCYKICPCWSKPNLLARFLSFVPNCGPFNLIQGHLDEIAVGSVIAVPKQHSTKRKRQFNIILTTHANINAAICNGLARLVWYKVAELVAEKTHI